MIGIIATLVLIATSPIIFSQFSTIYSFENSGQIGDTIGGLTAPFVNLLAAFLVYKSFSAQIQANQRQRQDYNEQMKEIHKEFDYNYINNLFTLIKSQCYPTRYAVGDQTNISFIRDAIITAKKEIEKHHRSFAGDLYLVSRKKNDFKTKKTANFIVSPKLKIFCNHLENLSVLIKEIKKSKIQSGMIHFYESEIEQKLQDMEVWKLIDSSFLKEMEDAKILNGNGNYSIFHSCLTKAKLLSLQGQSITKPINFDS